MHTQQSTLGFFGLPFALPALSSIVDVGGDLIQRAVGTSGGDYPKPLPPPMPYSDQEIADMLTLAPDVRAAIVERLKVIRKYLTPFLGRPVTDADLSNTDTVARLARWAGDGLEGVDLNETEEAIRVLVFGGMDRFYRNQAATMAAKPPFPWDKVLVPAGLGVVAFFLLPRLAPPR